jgi:hypothetical protein
MPDKGIVFNDNALADEAITRNPAMLSHAGILLNLDLGAYLCSLADGASVEVDELRQLNIVPQLHIFRDAVIRVHK